MKCPVFTVGVAVATILAATGCSPRQYPPSAEERAQLLNDDKSQARALLDAERYRDALDLLAPLAEKASADHQVFVMTGDAHAGLDEYDEAVAAYESALRVDYLSHEAHLKLATLLMRNGRVGRALTEFELALEYGDRNPLTHYNYGLALREMGREDEALGEWRRAHEMDPENPRYAEAVGIGLAGRDDEEAELHFARAAQLGADSPAFHNNYGLVLQRLGRAHEADRQFGAAVAATPGNEGYRFNRAALYMQAEWFERAAAEWEAMAAIWGPRWSYSVYRARALVELGRFEAALAALEGVDLDAGPGSRDRVPPEVHEAMDILARAHRGAGEPRLALDFIRRAVELVPDDTGYRNTYGVILAENGMIAEAKVQWRKVLETDEDNAIARENLSRFGP